MTIDEAIKHAEEVAEEHTKYNIYGGFESCDECAEEHRQLAEWLRELKRNRDVLQEIREEIRKDAEWWSEHDSLREQVLRDVIEDIIDKYIGDTE